MVFGSGALVAEGLSIGLGRVPSPKPWRTRPAQGPAKVPAGRRRFGDLVGVDGVGFHIDPGETYGLLGPNGAGKTTTISMIAGLLDRDDGEVVVAGEPMSTHAIRTKSAIGYVPQDLAIYPDLSSQWPAVLAGVASTSAKSPRVIEV